MAIAVDDTTVAVLSLVISGPNPGGTGTTGSFTAPANSLLVLCAITDTAAGTTPTLTISNTGTSLTWSEKVRRGDAAGTGGCCAIVRALNASSQSITVTATWSNINVGAVGETRGKVKIYIVTGHDTTTPDGTTGQGSSTTNNLSVTAYNSTANNSRGFGCAEDWNALGTVTSSDTEVALECAGSVSGVALYKATDTATSGTGVSMNFDAAGSSAADWNWVAYEVVPAAGAGGRTTKNTRAFPLGMEIGMNWVMPTQV